jgi:hypothetical protein
VPVSVEVDGFITSVLVFSSEDELTVLRIPIDSAVVVTEFVFVSASTDD